MGKQLRASRKSGDDTNSRVLLGLLESVERDSGGQSQRRLAAELDVALGLVKVSQTPARHLA